MADYATLVYDNVLFVTVTMSADDALFATQKYPGRFSYVTSPLASVPQLSASLIAGVQALANFRNVLDGGDFTVNPWQRGTTFTGITSTATYTADRWAARGAGSSSLSVSRVAIANGFLPGFSQALQFGRAASNTDVNPLNLAQEIETADTIRLQGQFVTLSYYVLAGANFSGGVLNTALWIGTGADEGVAKLINGAASGFAGAASLAAIGGSGAITPTTSWQRVFETFQVPVAATEGGVVFSYTPSGTAGAADYVQIAGVQLEVGAAVSAFEHRDIQVELEICQRYAWLTNEPASGVVVGAGMNTGSNTQVFYMATPVQMRVPPTVTVTAGTFKTNQAGTATSTTITPGTTHTPNAISVNGNSSGTAGQASLLQGGGGSGIILASADF